MFSCVYERPIADIGGDGGRFILWGRGCARSLGPALGCRGQVFGILGFGRWASGFKIYDSRYGGVA